MANYWLHNGFLQVEGQKMSKSLGNFITIHELLETEKFGGRKWPGEVLRLAMLMTHYREPIDFSVKRLEEAEATLRKWQRLLRQSFDRSVAVPADVVDALSDDLNVSLVLRQLARYVSAASNSGLSGVESEDDIEQRRFTGASMLAAAMRFLGFATESLLSPEETEYSSGVADLVASRLAALAARDFATADQIRKDLAAEGVQLMDYKDESGQRQTKWEFKR